MPGKIFVNYRRDDVPGDARGVRDGLVAKFGRTDVFMDVDNLLVGQRFDMELAKALDDCDMLIAVIGPRWLELLRSRLASGERDYVREEIAEALKRRIAVVPVRVGREGSMHALPRPDELPEDIRDLVLYQKHDVAHERFGRDIAELIEAIVTLRKSMASGARAHAAAPRGRIAAALLVAAGLGAGVYFWQSATQMGSDPSREASPKITTAAREGSDPKTAAEQAAREEALRKELAETKAAAAEAQRKAEEAAKAEAERKRREEQRLAMLAKEEEDRKRKEAEEAARRASAQPKPGETFRDCPECPEMVVVPAGSFMMGSPETEQGRSPVKEGPQHEVTIAKPFAVGKFEVTFAEWDACVSGGGCRQKPEDEGWGRSKRPVINVSWDEITKNYLPWLSSKTGKAYRLLSEAEWEYAARAGTTTKYAFGDAITKQQAQFSQGFIGSAGKTVEVGSFQPNAFGLYDMHGNVWEWVEDCWGNTYNGAPADGSARTSGDCSGRVLRGGSWSYFPDFLRSAYRLWNLTLDRNLSYGFRVGRTLTP